MQQMDGQLVTTPNSLPKLSLAAEAIMQAVYESPVVAYMFAPSSLFSYTGGRSFKRCAQQRLCHDRPWLKT